MDKELLINEAVQSWCLYGHTINKSFEFNNFLIESKPLENILKTNSEEKILKFIEYIKTQIVILEKL